MRIRAGSHNDLAFGFMEMFVKDDYGVKLPTSTPTIIDCGANVGMALLYFKARYPASRVICFEPNPASCELIEWHIRENRLQNVTLNRVACGAAAGEASFFVNAKDSIVSSFYRERANADVEIKVPVVRLSESIKGPVDLLKIDVEGAEWDIIQDLIASGKMPLIKSMIIEYHHQIKGQRSALSGFLRMIEEAGYRYEVTSEISKHRRLTGGFQDVMIYASQRGSAPAFRTSSAPPV
ncbi:MAG TPA: FkbM family methyltransferase [Lacunisphaera sp.]|nr:FkbM family methyltransferase [Lacunisphaera sp.]